jgi:hypothetical protein
VVAGIRVVANCVVVANMKLFEIAVVVARIVDLVTRILVDVETALMVTRLSVVVVVRTLSLGTAVVVNDWLLLATISL